MSDYRVKFDNQALAVIDKLSNATGRAQVDVIRDALGLYECVIAARERGLQVVFAREDVPEQEVVLPCDVKRSARVLSLDTVKRLFSKDDE